MELPEDPFEDDPDVELDVLLESFDPPASFVDESFADEPLADDPESEDPDDDSDEELDDSDAVDVELLAFSRLSLR